MNFVVVRWRISAPACKPAGQTPHNWTTILPGLPPGGAVKRVKQTLRPETTNAWKPRLFAPLIVTALVGLGLLGTSNATADDEFEIPPTHGTMAIPPCLDKLGATTGIVEVCFHSPGDYMAVTGIASGTYTARAELWSYRVPTTPDGGTEDSSNDAIIPCVELSVQRPEQNATTVDCESIGNREQKLYGAALYVYAIDPPELGVIGYIVEVRLDAKVLGFGLDDEESLLFCRDPQCDYI